VEGRLARLAIRTAGFLLSSALVLSAAACGRPAAPYCKASSGSSACSAAKNAQPRILPNPPAVAKSQAPTRIAGQAPAPSQPKPSQTARRAVRHGAYPKASQGYYRQSGQEAYDDWRITRREEPRPPSGPLYESWLGGADTGGCDQACRYHDWFQRYGDWYNRYSRNYRSGRAGAADAPADPSNGPAYSYNGPTDYRGNGRPLNQSERDRMDPWHGYNSHDGLENGY
jgi:hypothetical protein